MIGITGSVGKTTAKEMISSVLEQRMNVLKTEGNLNNQIGVPMTVSRIEREHEAAVIEMGISGFGEMTALARIAQPTVAVFTVIGHAHLEFLHDLEGGVPRKDGNARLHAGGRDGHITGRRDASVSSPARSGL